MVYSFIQEDFLQSVRTIYAQVKILHGSTTTEIACNTDLQEIEIQRVADEGKFFGMIVCQRLHLKIRDVNRTYAFSAGDRVRVYWSNDLNFERREERTNPSFYISEINRDENTNQLQITAYDVLYTVEEHTYADIKDDIEESSTAYDLLTLIASESGLTLSVSQSIIDILESITNVEGGINYGDDATFRDILEDLAEATQSLLFMNYQDKLVFKRYPSTTDFTITKSYYYSLDTSTNRRLSAICSETELGDNITASTGQTGTTQYLYENGLYNNNHNTADLLDDAIDLIGGLTIGQFDCEWCGLPNLEPGDRIGLIDKDGNTVISYLLDDVITYTGSYRETTRWAFGETQADTESNPTTIGDKINQTIARVDKQNQTITQLVSYNERNVEKLTELELSTSGILIEVSEIRNNIADQVTGLQAEVQKLQNKVNASITSEDVQLMISKSITTDVESVTTTTGFTFNDEGLTISKTGSEMTTLIDEDGMTIQRNGSDALVVNNQGVIAYNLTAQDYLTIGKNSRFQDYDNDSRTGCFWIGG